jgi:hypothetical protein
VETGTIDYSSAIFRTRILSSGFKLDSTNLYLDLMSWCEYTMDRNDIDESVDPDTTIPTPDAAAPSRQGELSSVATESAWTHIRQQRATQRPMLKPD